MNELEQANRVWQDKRRALVSARAGLTSALQRKSQRDINYYWEVLRQTQEAEANALIDAKRLLTP